MKKEKGHSCLTVWGIFFLLIVMPIAVYAGDLTIGTDIASTTGNWSLSGNMTVHNMTANYFSGNGASLTNLNPANLSSGTASISISGTAASITGNITELQVTNLTTDLSGKVSTAGSYANPSWITSLSGSKISGNIAGNAASITGNIPEAQVTNLTTDLSNKVSTTGSYGNPSWIATLDGSKITGNISSVNNLNLPATSTTAGQITLGGSLFIHGYGSANTFVGINAGNLSITGSDNTASGYNSLSSNATGSDNTASGYGSLYDNTTGSDNTASGAYSLSSNTIGSNNTASGYGSLIYNTTASQNTAVGSKALYTQSYSNGGTAWNSDNTAVGYGALYSNQPDMTSDGMGNTAVGSKSLNSNTLGGLNTACGAYSLIFNTTGFQNTAFGIDAGFSNTIGNANTFIGSGADAAANNLNDSTAIGFGAVVNASFSVRIGDTNVTHIGGQVGFSNDSDIRAKKGIQDINFGIDFIKSLRPVEFRMKNGNDRIDFGFIAQDIEVLLGTGYNILGIGGDTDRSLSLRYTDFIAPMVKAMQEQQAIIEAQQGQIRGLEDRLSRLEALLGDK